MPSTNNLCSQEGFWNIHSLSTNCGVETVWNSQLFINNIPAGNILLSSAVLFSGSLPEKALRMLSSTGCASISTRTYYEHQQKYLLPSIFRVWDQYQQCVLALLADDKTPLVLAGDGRSDSPGCCAKYGTYSVIDMTHNVIIDCELVQVSHILYLIVHV